VRFPIIPTVIGDFDNTIEGKYENNIIAGGDGLGAARQPSLRENGH
jgi:hypothetical protein